MKINYVLNENNIITSWCRVPFDENKPWIELPDGTEIHENFDQVIDHTFVPNNAAWEDAQAKKAHRAALYTEMAQLKDYLNHTDYQAIKYAEGVLTAEEYAETKQSRAAARARINEIEAELGL